MRVTLQDPPRMNLLGFFLRSLMERAVAAGPLPQRLLRRRARVVVEAGGMTVSLLFGPDEVEIRRGRVDAASASLSGGLADLLAAADGASPLLLLLRGRLALRGDPGTLWATRALLRRRAS